MYEFVISYEISIFVDLLLFLEILFLFLQNANGCLELVIRNFEFVIKKNRCRPVPNVSCMVANISKLLF